MERIERMEVYARDEKIADLLRTEIKNIEGSLLEELRTGTKGYKFEFFGTMFDGIKLMGLGASSFGKL